MRKIPLNSPSDGQLAALAANLAKRLSAADLRLASAESCTGGWVAKLCTDLAGSSAWFECGFVTYSNRAKQRLLGVTDETLARFGAVSEATVLEMAGGALLHSDAERSLAISGIAGPGGATVDKPLGMVCFAWGWRDGDGAVHAQAETCCFAGERDQVRRQAVAWAIQGVLERV